MGLIALARFATLITLRRTVADWRLQAAAGLGMVLAVALMASGVIYHNALKETALGYTLRNVPDEELNVLVRVFHALERPQFDASKRFVNERMIQPLRPHFQGSSLLIQTSTFFFTGLPQLDQANTVRPRGNLQTMTRLNEGVRVVAGRLPQPASGRLEVVIDPLGASALDLSLNQGFQIFSALREDIENALPVQVVGIIELIESTDQYESIGKFDQVTNTEREYTTLPLYTHFDALFDTVGTSFPGLHTDFTWLLPFDRDALSASEADQLRATVQHVINDVRTDLPNSTLRTELDEVLKRHAALLTVAQVPLFLVMSLAIGLLLYYLFFIAGLMGRLRAPEVALFRSRGASTPQVGVVLFVEGLLMAIPAISVGPFLAQALVLLTGRLFPAASRGQGLASVDLSLSVFLLGAVGAMLSVIVLTATTLSSARHGVVAFRQTFARPPEIPFLHRYYLDLALLALIGLVWWQIQSRESFFVLPLSNEGMEIDLTLFLGPILGVITAGLLLLRVFPIILKIAVWLANPVSPAWLVHSLRRVARDPVPSGSLLVLLVLATSLGVLGSTVIATLERSQRDQAAYQAGAEVRIHHSLGVQTAAGQSVAQSLTSLPDVDAATDVMRLDTSVTTAAFGKDATFLAVDTEAFPQVAWTRPGLIGTPLTEALRPLRPAEIAAEGVPLPANATSLGIWTQPGLLSGSVTLQARLQDSQGIYFNMVLGELSGQGWRYLQAPIQPAVFNPRRETPPVILPPYTLHTIWVGASRGGRTTGAVFLDQLQAVTPEGSIDVESFQSLERWHPLEDASTPGLYSLELSESVTRPGRRSAAFTWGAGGLALRGIRAGSPERPLPAIVSHSFLDDNQVNVGDSVSVYVGTVVVPIKIVGLADFFPTLDPREAPFLITDLASVSDYLALHTRRPVYSGMEVWAGSADGDLTPESLHQAITERGGTIFEAYDATSMIATRARDPLLTAGWSGLLALSFLVVVLASALGLVLYTYLDSRDRLGEFAVLRTLGFSHQQINGMVWFNLALTIALGLAVGTLSGQWLSNAVLPLLEVAEGGTRITPPMVLQNNWPALGLAYLVLAAATSVTVAGIAWSIRRLQVQRLLRIAEA